MQVSLLYPFVCGFDIYVSNANAYTDTGTENLSEYELARLKRIARNKARLRALGLLKEQITPPKKTRCKRKSTEPTTPSRASKRLKGLEPDGKTIISKDTSEDTSSRPPVQEQQSLPPISDNRKAPTHFNLGQALDIVRRLNPKCSYLIGMSCDSFLPHDEMNKELRKLDVDIQLAHDGLFVEV